jgi:hypothetical protein
LSKFDHVLVLEKASPPTVSGRYIIAGLEMTVVTIIHFVQGVAFYFSTPRVNRRLVD